MLYLRYYDTETDREGDSNGERRRVGDKGSNMDDSELGQSLYYINMKWGSDSFAQCDLSFDFDLMPV